MKKSIFLFIVFMSLVFLIPSVFSRSFLFSSAEVKNENQENNTKEDNTEEPYDYSQYATIKLLHKDNQSIEEIPLDTYLLGVVSAEMPASFEQEALNAQALVARTYTLYKIVNQNKKHGFQKKIDWQSGKRV